MKGNAADLIPEKVKIEIEDIATLFERYCNENEYLYPIEAAKQVCASIEQKLEELGYGECRISVVIN